MKKLFLSIFLSFFFLSNFYAQTTDKNQSTPVSTEILTDGNLAYGSNCLTNKLLRTLIWGGHFNETDKDKVAAKLSSENRFRFDSRYYLSAKWTLPSQNKFGFSIGQRYFIDAGFSKNFAKTLLYGNAQWGNQRVNLGKQRLSMLQYTFLQFHYSPKPLKFKNNFQLSFALAGNFLLGNQWTKLCTQNSWIETTLNSEKLVLESDILYQKNSKNLFNGYGTGLDLTISLQGAWDKGKWKMDCFIQDLGFIQWSKKSLDFTHHFNINFEGFVLSPPFSQKQSIFSPLVDSLQQEIDLHTDYKQIFSFTPASIHLESEILFNVKPSLNTGFAPFATVSLFSYPIYRFGIAPTVEIEQKIEKKEDIFKFLLPISFSNLYGLGIGLQMGYEAKRWSKTESYIYRYRCFLGISEFNFRGTSCHGGVTFCFSATKN